MAEYNVRVGTNTHRVALRQNPQFNLDVNYQIPTKSTQFTNLILDDISASFDKNKDIKLNKIFPRKECKSWFSFHSHFSLSVS